MKSDVKHPICYFWTNFNQVFFSDREVLGGLYQVRKQLPVIC